ncbi:lipid II flippase MurJ [Desulfovibrio sp.]|uniref:murein biosynthesis integral membrane protein MurJ n=1 Tax=Desulfovibrio sp. TaxID=885 RepID=UPI0025B82F26|nr:lipid II flippase MurJ [Desulfovibrio sp.]
MSKNCRQQNAAPSGGLARTAALLGGFALFSRLLGLARDMGMAWLLGGGAAADALVAAMRLPHVLRRLLGEGSLSMTLTASLVRLRLGGGRVPNGAGGPDGPYGPYGSDGPTGEKNTAMGLLARALSLRLGLVLVLFTLVGLAAAPWLAKALAPGFSGAELERTVFLLRLCLPYVLAAGMAALGMALLHSMGIFWLPALSPALFNMVMLLAAGAAALGFFPPAPALAAGMLCGGIAQWLAQWLAVRRLLPGSFMKAPQSPPEHALGQVHALGTGAENTRAVNRAAWRCLRLLPGGVLGAAAPQLAMLAAMALASGLGQGQVAALYYAERLLELPLGLVGVCLGMASLPALSRLAAEGDFSRFGQHLSTALRLTLMLSLPAAAGLAALGPQLVEGLLGHGAFDRQASLETGLALLAYVPGLPAFACNRSLLAACNALGLVRHTAMSALWTVGGTLVAGLALTRMLGPEYSVLAPALAVSCGLWLQCVLLLRLLGKTLPEDGVCLSAGRKGFWPGLPLWLPAPPVVGRHVLAGGLTGLAANALLRLCAPWGVWPSLLAGIAGGVAVWALVLLILRDPDMLLLAGRLRKKPRGPIVDGSA